MNDAEYIRSLMHTYQSIKYVPEVAEHLARLEAIAKKLESVSTEQSDDFPIGPACDLSKEGGCDSSR